MSSRLDQITDWRQRIQAANYSVKPLAAKCGVSQQHLLRFFKETTGVTAHQWMHERRQKLALALLFQGKSVKETTRLLGYTQVSNFSRDFKLFHGVPPGEFCSLPPPMFIPDNKMFNLDNCFVW
jgi:AraC-like DNA-binding protein